MSNNKNVDKETLFKQILRSLPDLFAYKNVEGVYEIVSKEVDELYKDRYDTIVGKSVEEVYSKEESIRIREMDQEVIDSLAPTVSVFRAETPKGYVTLDSRRTPIFSENGELLGIASTSRDAGVLVETTHRLGEMMKLQNVIIDVSKSLVNVAEDNFDLVMTEALRMLGEGIYADRAYVFEYNFSENTMNNTHEWCAEDITPEIDNLQGIPISFYLDGWVNSHRQKDTVYIPDLMKENPESNIYKVLQPQGIKTIVTLPIFIDNECYGFIGFDAVKKKRDWEPTTESFSILPDLLSSFIKQNRILKELSRANKKAENASNIQSDFIAKMTHELRTPINGIQNALYLFQNTNLTSDQNQYAEVMEYSIEVLSSMVNNVLDYSKIEKSKLIFKSSDISLENEIIKLIKVNKYMANSKELGLYLNYDYSIPDIVSADIEKLRQILNNLIVNAIKYTNYGHVEIKVSLLRVNAPYVDIRFEVIDTGIGISEKDQNNIFEEFFQVGDSLNKKPQGTGLGLTITKEFLQFLKSDLYVESKVKKGSTFSFDLKLFAPSKEKRQVLDQSALVLDLTENKHSNTVDFLKAHFSQIDVSSIRNFRQCVRENYDSLFVYINDSLTFVEKIAKIEDVLDMLEGRMKRVLLFDQVKSNEIVDTFDLFDCTLEVPMESEMLIERLTMCKTKNQTMQTTELIPKEKKQKILLVDDNNINRKVMGELLKGMYIDVTEAKDGFEALEKVKQESFNMIFMDILMPGIDGYETSRRIRALKGVNGSVPIIAVTANDAETTKDKIVENGMNGVLPKPLRKGHLESLLNEYFGGIMKQVEDSNQDSVVFDSKEFELFYEEPFLRKEIIDTFLQEKDRDLERISRAFLTKNCDLIHKALHYMKGSFTYLKANKILKLTQQILDLTDQKKLSEVLVLEKPLLHNYDLLLTEITKYSKQL